MTTCFHWIQNQDLDVSDWNNSERAKVGIISTVFTPVQVRP